MPLRHLEEIALGVDLDDARFVRERGVENEVGAFQPRVDVERITSHDGRPPKQRVLCFVASRVAVADDATK